MKKIFYIKKKNLKKFKSNFNKGFISCWMLFNNECVSDLIKIEIKIEE